MNFHKLENSSATGTLLSAERHQETFDGNLNNRVYLTGNWDGIGQAIINAPAGVIKDLVNNNIVTDSNGSLIVSPNSRLTISKMGKGKGNVRWSLVSVGGSSAPQTAQNGVQSHAPAKGQPAQPKPTEGPMTRIYRHGCTMSACLKEAKIALAENGFDSPSLSELHAIAATIFIQVCREGSVAPLSESANKRVAEARAKIEASKPKPPPPPPMTAEQAQAIEAACISLGYQFEGAIESALGVKKIGTSLTYAEADKVWLWIKDQEARAMDPEPPTQNHPDGDIPF